MKRKNTWKSIMRTDADKAATIAFYNRRALIYDSYPHLAQEPCEVFAKSLRAGDTVLDVGCGSGKDMLALQELGLQPVGIDASIEMAKIAWRRNLSVYFDDFENFAFLEVLWLLYRGNIDGIWSKNALLHTTPENFPNIIKMLRRLLRKKGSLFLGMKESISPEIEEENRSAHHGSKYYCYWPRERLIHVVEHIGFTLQTLRAPQKDSYGERNLLEMFFVKK